MPRRNPSHVWSTELPTAEDLAGVPLFADLDTVTRTELAGRFDVEEFAAGRSLVAEGAAGYAFYVIAEGHVTVASGGRPLGELGPGDYFGEIAILGEGRRTATVTARTKVEVWVLFGTAFRVLQTSRPDIAEMLVQAMKARLQDE